MAKRKAPEQSLKKVGKKRVSLRRSASKPASAVPSRPVAKTTPRQDATKYSMPVLPADDPIFTMGYIVGQTMGDPSAARTKSTGSGRAASHPGRIQVSPPIFCIRVWNHPRPKAAAKVTKAAIVRGRGTFYGDVGGTAFFGFRRLDASEALAMAIEVRRICAGELKEAEVSLSASTLAPKKWARIISAPWLFIGSEELSEALNAGVQFNPVEAQ
jgi:hypothetical protein